MKPRHLLCVDDSMSFDGPNATISDTEQSHMCTHSDPLNWTFSKDVRRMCLEGCVLSLRSSELLGGWFVLPTNIII